ncbi:hypothetical protein [Streptomyces parvulus]|uniref:hypothetical protein n=1 Tax=Streptomyces parvulus TaxID=146923 RepID=UPI0036BE7071
MSELERMMARVGALGRLRMSVERATAIMHAGGVGVVTTLLSSSAPDLTVSEATRRAVFAAIIVPRAEDDPAGPTGAGFAGPAMALRAALDTTGATALSPGELLLLRELLDRLADTPG